MIVSDGSRNIFSVSSKPSLVIATRGAEPIAEGGYRAVLLLDGERMLSREGLTVEEACVREWATAISLAAPDAPSLLVGVSGRLGASMATWQLRSQSESELLERRQLRFPPSVRVATLTGDLESLVDLGTNLSKIQGIDILGPMEVEDGRSRTIVRFDYSTGREVASIVKSSLIKASMASRKARGHQSRLTPDRLLRAKFDDYQVFDSPNF